MEDSQPVRRWTYTAERDYACMREGNPCCCPTCIARDDLENLAPKMAEAIIDYWRINTATDEVFDSEGMDLDRRLIALAQKLLKMAG